MIDFPFLSRSSYKL